MTGYGKGVGFVAASIKGADVNGGFTAVASTPEIDRDGESLAAGCFNPLPASVPVHADHTISVGNVIGRARPYYTGQNLMIDVSFGSTPDAQLIRQKVADGIVDTVSVMFRGAQWEQRDGVRTCVSAELLSVDLVSIPSNRGALVTSARGLNQTGGYGAAARELSADTILWLARLEVAEAKRYINAQPWGAGPVSRQVSVLIANALLSKEPTLSRVHAGHGATTVHHFLRSI